MDIYAWIKAHVKAETALRALVLHDIAADEREGLPHCVELLVAIEAVQELSKVNRPDYDSISEDLLPDIDGQNLTD